MCTQRISCTVLPRVSAAYHNCRILWMTLLGYTVGHCVVVACASSTEVSRECSSMCSTSFFSICYISVTGMQQHMTEGVLLATQSSISGKLVAHEHVCVFSRATAHLDKQWCQPFAPELLVHTQKVDLHHALGVASYTYGCRHSCTAKTELSYACQKVDMVHVSASQQAESTS